MGPDQPTDKSIVLVAAVAENGVIGTDEGMPWHYPADLAHFKRLTTGHPVIVGRRTYEGIVDRLGGPLPSRTSVVLTSRSLGRPDGVFVANSLAEATEIATADAADRGVNDIYVIGGGTVYEQYLGRADQLVITEIPDRPDGDTTFPAWDPDNWIEVARETTPVDDGAEAAPLEFVTYERVSGTKNC